MGYILAAVLVALILLLIQANEHIAGILLAASSFAAVRAPLLISCMVLALFPAAVIYSFVTQLKAVAKSYESYRFGEADAVSNDVEVDPAARNFPWFGVCVLLILANWFLMIVEIFYTWYLGENPLAQDYRFYDIFVIYTMIFLSMAVMLYQIFASERVNRMLFIMLVLSDAGLTVIVCFRLYAYVKFHGLWADRGLFVITLLLCSTVLFCTLFFSCRQPVQFIQSTGTVVAILLAVLLILPKGFVLTEVNTSIFLHKYHTQQLSCQTAVDEGAAAELSEDDLRLDLIEY